jgi:hypothetical protein
MRRFGSIGKLWNWTLSLAGAGLLLGMTTGCSTNATLVRGQNPDPNVCRDCYADRVLCRVPHQHYRFTYEVPQGLSYPPDHGMPAFVQYPYYTLKGPDCFFFDNDGP